jgi:pantoate--beta-alanine ligase
VTLVLKTAAQVRAFCADLKQQRKSLALVPTMGFLHAGHVSLMREAKQRCDAVAVSIFVNPTQFGPNEDLSRYPRDFEGDVKQCDGAGVEVVYAPGVAEVYPPGFQTFVNVEHLSTGLCGEKRPGHFRGVATVVAKLLALFRPDVALFGEKDFQQLQVIKRLNRDLDLGAQIVGLPTIREPDGLAMSSRNKYLSEGERHSALAIWRSMQEAQRLVQSGETSSALVIAATVRGLDAAGFRVDYVDIRDSVELKFQEKIEAPARIFVAAFMGQTRLIDNMEITLPQRDTSGPALI